MDEEPTGAAGDAPAAESEAIFSVLGDETRLEVLLELANRYEPDVTAMEVPFSELRRAVGVEDAGRFNYHLDKLQDTFVRKGEDGYRPTLAALEVASSIYAGRYAAEATDRTAETEYDCPECGEPLTILYEQEVLFLACQADHSPLSFPVPRGAAVDRSLAELLDVALRRAASNLELARNGLCPRCWGHASVTLSEEAEAYPGPGEERHRADVACERCWLDYNVSAVASVADSPPAVAFWEDHGIDYHEVFLSDPDVLRRSDATLRSSDPPRFDVRFVLDDAELSLVVDEHAQILEYSRSSVPSDGTGSDGADAP
jgi:DNA-binding transcriptional ArsR family regulator